ncbi:LTA synthase family protein [Parabacteroides sp. AF17-28]|uniref:LTA synthase family protein n=2 Tax=Parabacteroides TaxID=375288 RepID=UPI000F00ABBD|nr:LTA synthase family protein [Parabacteroides sp. AF17-28]RHR53668.1 LTA synthase family protein [Parabacteroides sp. AF17-28]
MFGNRLYSKVLYLFFICLVAKFFFFDFLWCLQTTFASCSRIETYLDAVLVTLVLLLPLVCFRAVKTTLAIFVLVDLLLVTNLMYFRTYFTAIPLSSYMLAGNLKDFTASVCDASRWTDLFFPLSTLFAGFVWWKYGRNESAEVPGSRFPLRYFLLILVTGLLSFGLIEMKRGYKAAFESLQNANMHTCGTPMYTVFGSLYYDYLREQVVYTPEIEKHINTWLADKPAWKPLPIEIEVRDNCILILAESLESWVLEKTVEGNEITPYLNKLLKDSTTLYAPYVLTQVKGGRSIDAQLLFDTGLLPIANGAYSTKFPSSYYPSVVKAFKEKYPGARAYGLTVDKRIVWNQNIVAPMFGYDQLLDKQSFILDERVGPHKKLGDVSFFRQCADKIEDEVVWNKDGHTFLQCVTYSGHNPFILPKELKNIFFSAEIPQRMNDYMTMANYTDRAIGLFIERLKQSGILNNTMVVVTGDHEGLADARSMLCDTKAGKGIVSDQQFTPLIIINSPVGMRYEKVMGQVDIYPTLLSLLGLDNYAWKGLGRSILDPDKKAFAIDPNYKVVGDAGDVSDEELRFAKDAWTVSDMIIRCDYLGRMNEAVCQKSAFTGRR